MAAREDGSGVLNDENPQTDLPMVSAVVVCTANICRSPTVAFLLARAGAVDAVSAGMRARPGSSMCPMAALAIAEHGDAGEYIADFRSQSIHALEPGSFDLVLTATRTMRGELVRANPLLRDRIFTVREAAALAGNALTAAEASTLLVSGPVPVLAARRGVAAPAAAHRGIRWMRGADPLDLPDAHNDRRKRRHAASIGLAVTAGAELGAALQAWRIAAPAVARPGS